MSSTNFSACVKDVPFDDARQFLDYLNPQNDQWRDATANPWIFRGHQNANWQLKPRAWRGTGPEELGSLVGVLRKEYPPVERLWKIFHRKCIPVIGKQKAEMRGENEDFLVRHFLLVAAEREAMWRFCDLADELGFQVPGEDDRETYSFNAEEKEFPGLVGYRHFYVSVRFGVAQHHGIPTRFLDWTRKPRIAAFFAASHKSCDDKDHEAEGLAVWALNQNALRVRTNGDVPYFVDTLTCPRHAHTFLHAQDGLFTLVEEANSYYLANREWPTLDQVVTQCHWLRGKDTPLERVTLPITERESLLELLWSERISIAHLMPAFDNVSAALRSKWEFDCRDRGTA